MKKFMVIALVGGVLFGLSAAGSWYMHKSKVPPEEAQADATSTGTEFVGKSERNSATAPAASGAQRTAVRPPHTPGAEEVVQLANTYRDRLASVKEREAQLAARQKQLELIYQDIRGERSAIDELRKQVTEEMKAVKEQMNNLDNKKTEVEDQRQKVSTQVKEIEDRLLRVEDIETGNVQRIAEMLNTMAPDAAAKILQQLSDTGKIDTAVKLLGMVKERQAAKILAESQDAALSAQLLERLKDLKRPATTKKTASNP